MDFNKMFPGHYKRANAIMIADGLFAVTLAYFEGDEWVLTDEGQKRAGMPAVPAPVAPKSRKKAASEAPLDDSDTLVL